jgi:sugar/nucleoside kinase (ribokinase family)
MKYDVITIGGATEDITFYTDEGEVLKNKKDILRQSLLAFEHGSKTYIDKSFSSFGGGAANSAVCLSRLGFKVGILTTTGIDVRGKSIIDNFRSQKVDVSKIKKLKKYDSAFSFVLVGPDKERITFSVRGAGDELLITNADLRFLKNTKWIYVSSLSGAWKGVLRQVFSVNKKKIAWNPGGVQIKSGLNVIGKFLKKTTVFCLNKDEAIELVVSDKNFKNKDNRFLNNVRNLQKILYSYGAEIILITNGKKGADVYDGDCFYHQNIIKEKKRVDSTGVGDAFNSSFVAGLEKYNGDIKKSMKIGLKNTASVIGQQGAQNGLLTKKNI